MTDTELLDWLDAHPHAEVTRTIDKKWQATANAWREGWWARSENVRSAIDLAADVERRANSQPNGQGNGSRGEQD